MLPHLLVYGIPNKYNLWNSLLTAALFIHIYRCLLETPPPRSVATYTNLRCVLHQPNHQ